MKNMNNKQDEERMNGMAVLTKPNKFTYGIKKDMLNDFIKNSNSKSDNDWVANKGKIFKKTNLKTSEER